jgi:capsular exopolysaccharide synthesis family protein
LRTALLLANSGMPPRTILVTSGLPSEGKTTIAINVAITLAQRGGRVLLVDGDLRRPSVHRHLMGTRKSRDEMPGLSHFLTGNSSLADAIQPSGLIPNLDVMLAGSIPPNPAELCSSEPMRKLLHDLREDYSHVIIDSPPLLSVTDSTILSVQTDGVLLVSRSGFSTRDSLRRAKKLLEHVNARLLGVVLNDLNLAVDGYYYYYYYGYYGYGRPDREVAHVPGN